MALGTMYYASSYFKCKTPTPTRGEPTHKSLKRLKIELQANTSSVERDLGGVNHGYLEVVTTEAEHAEIPNASPFVAPECQHSLTTRENSTPIKALELKDKHAEQKKTLLRMHKC